MRRTTWLVGIGLLLAGPGYAEEKLALIIPEIFGSGGLKVDSAAVLPNGQTHSAHFNGAFQTQFTQFNVALASQLTSLPVPSPASGFSYTFDASSASSRGRRTASARSSPTGPTPRARRS